MAGTENSDAAILKKYMDEKFKPMVSMELATDLASRLYGLEVTEVKPMDSFNDQNFLIKVSKDHRNPYIEQVLDQGYTLKIVNTFKSNLENHIESVHAGMIQLYEKGLRVPQPVKNLEGKTWKLEVVPLQIKDRKPSKELKCGIHLLTYIPGIPVATIKNTEDNFFEWGVLLANFHTALEDLDCPAMKSKAMYSDAKYFSLMRGFFGGMKEGVLDAETKTLVQNVFERYTSEVEVLLDNLPQGFVHGDFNDYNILAQVKEDAELDETAYTTDGILDFDDMHYGSWVWDLGLMLGHALMVEMTTDPLEAAGHAVAGYRSLRHLNELELSLLKIFMESRISMTTLSTIVAKEDPTNSYVVMRSSLEPKKNMLKRLANTDVKDLLSTWDNILKMRGLDVK